MMNIIQQVTDPMPMNLRRCEEIRSRREYDGDEVEAVKLFLTGGDGVAAALWFEKLECGREWLSRVKEVRKGEGVFIVAVKNCSPEDLGRTCPWPFSFA